MPNWCYFGAGVFFKDNETASSIHSLLQKMQADADKENRGIDLGMETNWVFDVEDYLIEQDDQYVTFQGSVRWGFSEEEIVKFCEWFVERGAEEIDVDYEESSNNILGEYIYNEGELINKYVPYDHKFWDKYHEGDVLISDLEPEDYYEEKLCKRRVDESVPSGSVTADAGCSS